MITIKNNTLEVEVTEEGAELRSIKYCNREYLYQGDHTWKRRAPILFPWAGRLRNLEYKYQGFTLSDIEEALDLAKAKLIKDLGPKMKDYTF